ncbi:hypothetical protein RRG08_064504 [Elysia crispata]|uniref:Uncharacterized protein n=1 Tax=Elysia crispata TaxID=231223 RepID=A0AAE1AE49_9GAST|nr:hypothetical protein RRG08_064504 [Elysia crispata]
MYQFSGARGASRSTPAWPQWGKSEHCLKSVKMVQMRAMILYISLRIVSLVQSTLTKLRYELAASMTKDSLHTTLRWSMDRHRTVWNVGIRNLIFQSQSDVARRLE